MTLTTCTADDVHQASIKKMAAAATVPEPIFKSNPALQKWSRDGGKGWLKIPLADNRYSFKVVWGENDYVVGLECRTDVSENAAFEGRVRTFTLAQVLNSRLVRKCVLADGTLKQFLLRQLFMKTFYPLEDFEPFQVATKTYPSNNTLRLIVNADEGAVQVDGLKWMTQSANRRRMSTTAGAHNNRKGAQKAIVIGGLFEYDDAASAANPYIQPTNFGELDDSEKIKLAKWDQTTKRKLEGLDTPTKKRKVWRMSSDIRKVANKRRAGKMRKAYGFAATFNKDYIEEQDPLDPTELFDDVPGQETRSGKKITVSNMGRVKTGKDNHITFGGDASHGQGYKVFRCNGEILRVHRAVLEVFNPAKIAEFKAAHPGIKWKVDHKDRQRNHNCIQNLRVVTAAQNSMNRSNSVAPLPTFPQFCDFCGFKRGAVDSIHGTVAKTAAERLANIARL